MINNMRGTPKTLIEAIRNGLDDSKNNPELDSAEIIKAHVRDFMSQKVNAFMFKHETLEAILMDVFEKIVGEDKE